MQITQIAYQIFALLLSLTALLFTSVILPWIVKTGIPWLRERRLDGIIRKYVEAAEKLCASGQLTIPKKEFVISLLKKRGIPITDEVNACIEACVIELDNASAQALFLIHEAFADHSHDENGDIKVN